MRLIDSWLTKSTPDQRQDSRSYRVMMACPNRKTWVEEEADGAGLQRPHRRTMLVGDGGHVDVRPSPVPKITIQRGNHRADVGIRTLTGSRGQMLVEPQQQARPINSRCQGLDPVPPDQQAWQIGCQADGRVEPRPRYYSQANRLIRRRTARNSTRCTCRWERRASRR